MPEEFVASIYPHLTLAQVFSALPYYEDHRDEVQAFQQRDQEYLEELQKSPPACIDVRRGAFPNAQVGSRGQFGTCD